MDKDLLLKIFSIGNSSNNESSLSDFIKDFLDSMGIPFKEDAIGNIYNVINKTKPILNAHLDSVQDSSDESLNKLVKIRGDILSGYGNIGADDKCGVFIILEILKTTDINFLFTVGEEIGCIGVNHFLSENDLEGYPWCLTLDRYGSSDIICYQNNYGTKEFEDALIEVGTPFGFKSARGVFSDADYLSQELSCANISVGYYAHHSKKEYVKISDLQNSINFVKAAIYKIDKVFTPPISSFKPYGFYDEYYDNYGDDFYSYSDKYYKEDVCAITGKKSKKLIYLDSIKKYVSPEGAKIIFEDLEESGILFEDTFYDDYSDDDIDEILKEVI